jgi:hypothetical protein
MTDFQMKGFAVGPQLSKAGCFRESGEFNLACMPILNDKFQFRYRHIVNSPMQHSMAIAAHKRQILKFSPAFRFEF